MILHLLHDLTGHFTATTGTFHSIIHKAKQINTRGSRRRAHHFFLPHQLFFFQKKNKIKKK